jgi:hypothetical protein
MNEIISFDPMIRRTVPSADRRADRTTGTTRESVRQRIRSFLVRTTLGPSTGDHVIGEGQWRSGTGFPTH